MDSEPVAPRYQINIPGWPLHLLVATLALGPIVYYTIGKWFMGKIKAAYERVQEIYELYREEHSLRVIFVRVFLEVGTRWSFWCYSWCIQEYTWLIRRNNIEKWKNHDLSEILMEAAYRNFCVGFIGLCTIIEDPTKHADFVLYCVRCEVKLESARELIDHIKSREHLEAPAVSGRRDPWPWWYEHEEAPEGFWTDDEDENEDEDEESSGEEREDAPDSQEGEGNGKDKTTQSGGNENENAAGNGESGEKKMEGVQSSADEGESAPGDGGKEDPKDETGHKDANEGGDDDASKE